MIPPGGEGEIKVTLRPKGTQTEITKDIVVFSNDPEQPRFTLTMKGSLLVDMVAQPASVMIPDVRPGEAGTQTISLLRTEGSTATVASVKLENPELFSVRELPAEPGALATYEIRFAGRKELGSVATRLVLATTGDNTPELSIPVRASVAYNLRYPKQFAFMRRDGQALERTINITTRHGDAPRIEKVEDPDGLLDVEVLEPRGPSTSIRMRVREDALARLGEGEHRLIVHTNDPDEPRLELTYRGMAPRAAEAMRVAGQ